MKEKNLDALHSSMEISIAGLGVLIHFKLKGILTDSTVWNTGETGDINWYSDHVLNNGPFNDKELFSHPYTGLVYPFCEFVNFGPSCQGPDRNVCHPFLQYFMLVFSTVEPAS